MSLPSKGKPTNSGANKCKIKQGLHKPVHTIYLFLCDFTDAMSLLKYIQICFLSQLLPPSRKPVRAKEKKNLVAQSVVEMQKGVKRTDCEREVLSVTSVIYSNFLS